MHKFGNPKSPPHKKPCTKSSVGTTESNLLKITKPVGGYLLINHCILYHISNPCLKTESSMTLLGYRPFLEYSVYSSFLPSISQFQTPICAICCLYLSFPLGLASLINTVAYCNILFYITGRIDLFAGNHE